MTTYARLFPVSFAHRCGNAGYPAGDFVATKAQPLASFLFLGVLGISSSCLEGDALPHPVSGGHGRDEDNAAGNFRVVTCEFPPLQILRFP